MFIFNFLKFYSSINFSQAEIRGGLEGQLAKLFVKLGRRRNGTFTVELAALLELAGLELDRLLSAVSRLKATHKVWLRWEKTAHFVRNTARFVSMQEVERRVETLTHKLFAELTSFEDRQLLRAQVMEDTLQLASSRNGPEQAALVNDVMEQYFASSDYATFAAGLATRLERELGPKPKPSASSDAELSATVSELIEGCTSLGGNPIALARILHAIPARSYPRAAWRGNRHWGRFAGELFPRLLGRVQLVLDERKDIFNFK